MLCSDPDCHATAAGRGARAVLDLVFLPSLLIIGAVCLRFFGEFVLYCEEDFEFNFAIERDEQLIAVQVLRQHIHDMARLLGDAVG